MLITTKRRYVKKHVIGGAGIFDSITNFVKRLTGSTATKAIVSRLSSAAQTEIGKKAIEAGKTIAKEVGLKAIDVGKDIAIAKANAFITQKSKETLSSLVGPSEVEGSSIAIQDLVKMLNTGSGLRLA